jgi:hypothetical protein
VGAHGSKLSCSFGFYLPERSQSPPTPSGRDESDGDCVRQRLQPAYSVEKLGSCELDIFQINQIAAENQP